MLTVMAILHLFIGLGLILFVLLQDPKGGAMGVFSGGSSSSSFFGSSGASNFLTTLTKWFAVLFAASCLALTYMTTHKGGSVMDSYVPPATTVPAVPSASDTPTPATPPVPPEETKAPADNKQ